MRSKRAFTITELIFVIALIAIISAIALPKIWVNSAQAQALGLSNKLARYNEEIQAMRMQHIMFSAAPTDADYTAAFNKYFDTSSSHELKSNGSMNFCLDGKLVNKSTYKIDLGGGCVAYLAKEPNNLINPYFIDGCSNANTQEVLRQILGALSKPKDLAAIQKCTIT